MKNEPASNGINNNNPKSANPSGLPLPIFFAPHIDSMEITLVMGDQKSSYMTFNGGEAYEGKTVTLTAPLDLSGSDWTPIGNGTRSGSGYTGNAFKGTFDGGKNTISGLTISSGAEAAGVGLFGVVDGGVVKDVTLTNVSINATSCKNVGAVAGVLVNNAFKASGKALYTANEFASVFAVLGL